MIVQLGHQQYYLRAKLSTVEKKIPLDIILRIDFTRVITSVLLGAMNAYTVGDWSKENMQEERTMFTTD